MSMAVSASSACSSAGRMDTPEELIQKAEDALHESDLSVKLDLIEAYSASFSEWLSGENASQIDEQQLLTLNQLHQRILETAKQLQNDTSGELARLRHRGKGILRYIDTLPKRISVRRSRKS